MFPASSSFGRVFFFFFKRRKSRVVVIYYILMGRLVGSLYIAIDIESTVHVLCSNKIIEISKERREIKKRRQLHHTIGQQQQPLSYLSHQLQLHSCFETIFSIDTYFPGRERREKANNLEIRLRKEIAEEGTVLIRKLFDQEPFLWKTDSKQIRENTNTCSVRDSIKCVLFCFPS